MSKTHKTDPYWVKAYRHPRRKPRHSWRCEFSEFGRTRSFERPCDIEEAGQHRTSRARVSRHYVGDRTVSVWVSTPWPGHTEERQVHYDHWVTEYVGAGCDYTLPEDAERKAWYRCSCCGPEPDGVARTRAEERAVLTDLARRANSGDEVDDYIFEKGCKWGGRW